MIIHYVTRHSKVSRESLAMPGSVSKWIAELKDGEAEAARMLWLRYSQQLIELSRRRLSGLKKGFVDEDDIAQSVFRCICRGAKAGHFEHIENRDEIWWMLISITMRKVASFSQREKTLKRGGGKVQHGSSLSSTTDKYHRFDFDELSGNEPSPDVIVVFEEEQSRLFGKLGNDSLRYVAASRIEGHTVEEIALLLAQSTRTIERKLQLIRDTWRSELCDAV